jgi:hypothetical protein
VPMWHQAAFKVGRQSTRIACDMISTREKGSGRMRAGVNLDSPLVPNKSPSKDETMVKSAWTAVVGCHSGSVPDRAGTDRRNDGIARVGRERPACSVGPKSDLLMQTL